MPSVGLQNLVSQSRSSGEGNPLGFYSYKVVIKQLDEEYYNAYLGNVIQGGFKDQQDSTGTLQEQGLFRTSVSYASLFGSNINKVPADRDWETSLNYIS